MLWRGMPRDILDGVRAGKIEIATSAELLAELSDVLGREKFKAKIAESERSVAALVAEYATLAKKVVPAQIAPFVEKDPDDDIVVACAIAANADSIVSGDPHLLNLEYAKGIAVVAVVEAVKRANLGVTAGRR